LSNEERLDLWRAFSDLFLDTEIGDVGFKYIARTIVESGLSKQEAENILWYEVYPVLESNLRSVAGVWDGWSDSWLLQHLKICEAKGTIHGEPSTMKEIKRCWSEVVAHLPGEKA